MAEEQWVTVYRASTAEDQKAKEENEMINPASIAEQPKEMNPFDRLQMFQKNEERVQIWLEGEDNVRIEGFIHSMKLILKKAAELNVSEMTLTSLGERYELEAGRITLISSFEGPREKAFGSVDIVTEILKRVAVQDLYRCIELSSMFLKSGMLALKFRYNQDLALLIDAMTEEETVGEMLDRLGLQAGHPVWDAAVDLWMVNLFPIPMKKGELMAFVRP